MTMRTPEQVNGAISRKTSVTLGLLAIMAGGGVPLVWTTARWCQRVEHRLDTIEAVLRHEQASRPIEEHTP